jgi:hypothetical protein
LCYPVLDAPIVWGQKAVIGDIDFGERHVLLGRCQRLLSLRHARDGGIEYS